MAIFKFLSPSLAFFLAHSFLRRAVLLSALLYSSHFLNSSIEPALRSNSAADLEGKEARRRAPRTEMSFQLLEINLISAQSLKKPSAAMMHQMQTYAVAWVDPTAKLRTRIDRLGAQNPTWNDKFVFRVPAAFLHPSSAPSSAVCFEIYAVGRILDSLIGTVRFLVGDLHLSASTPSFVALQIRRPSGRFHGILNIGAMLLPHDLHAAMAVHPAIGYRDLTGENLMEAQCRNRGRWTGKKGGDLSREAADFKGAFKGSNGRSKGWDSGRKGILRGLGIQKKIHLSPTDQDMNLALKSNR